MTPTTHDPVLVTHSDRKSTVGASSSLHYGFLSSDLWYKFSLMRDFLDHDLGCHSDNGVPAKRIKSVDIWPAADSRSPKMTITRSLFLGRQEFFARFLSVAALGLAEPP